MSRRNPCYLLLCLFFPLSLFSISDSLSIKQRIAQLNAKSEIQFSSNDAVKQKITYYSTKGKSVISRALGLAPLYFPLIEAELRKNNLPTELKYITIRESGLNPSAGSEKGPYGLWQFTAGTAQALGMKVNSYVDDRKDPLLSTKAACAYFTKLYKIYGDWLLVMAAYGSGSGTIDKAIKASGGKKNYWDLLPFLSATSKDHIPAFMGIAFVYTYAESYGINGSSPRFSAAALDSVQLTKSLSFEQISKVLNIVKSDLVLLNPRYNKQRIHVADGDSMLLVLPPGEALHFRREEKEIYQYKEAAH